MVSSAFLDSKSGSAPSGIPNTRLGVDISAGHSCFPPTYTATGSITTFTDQFAQVRISDLYVVHCCPPPGPGCHAPVAIVGSTNTFADMLAKHRIGDATDCGDMAATGSLTTYTG